MKKVVDYVEHVLDNPEAYSSSHVEWAANFLAEREEGKPVAHTKQEITAETIHRREYAVEVDDHARAALQEAARRAMIGPGVEDAEIIEEEQEVKVISNAVLADKVSNDKSENK